MKLRTLLDIGTCRKTVFRAMAEEALEEFAKQLRSHMEFHANGLLVLDAGGGQKAGGSASVFLTQLNLPPRTQVVSVNIDPFTHPHILANLSLGWPFKSSVFDIVVSTWVLEHLDNPKHFCEEASRVLKPGGWLVITVPFLYHKHGAPHDYYRFTDYALRYMLATSGFSQVGIIPVRSGPFLASCSIAWPVLRVFSVFPLFIALFMDWLISRMTIVLKKGSWIREAYHLGYIAFGRR